MTKLHAYIHKYKHIEHSYVHNYTITSFTCSIPCKISESLQSIFGPAVVMLPL